MIQKHFLTLTMLVIILLKSIVSSPSPIPCCFGGGKSKTKPIVRAVGPPLIDLNKNLSKNGKKIEKILEKKKSDFAFWDQSKERRKYMNQTLKEAGEKIDLSSKKMDSLRNQLKSQKRNPNSIKGKIRSFIKNTPENLLKKETKEYNKNQNYITNALSDSRQLFQSKKIWKSDMNSIQRSARQALQSQYAVTPIRKQ